VKKKKEAKEKNNLLTGIGNFAGIKRVVVIFHMMVYIMGMVFINMPFAVELMEQFMGSIHPSVN
jgi:hypothetical protein